MTTILFIEDAMDLAQVIRRDIEQEGYHVLRARDGAVGLQMFRSCQPDLVILDWMLPELDGLAVLRSIRSDSPVSVLMLIARTEEAQTRLDNSEVTKYTGGLLSLSEEDRLGALRTFPRSSEDVVAPGTDRLLAG